MNKLDLIESLKDKNGLLRKEAKAIVKLFFNEITDALAKGDRAEIRGFCSFYVKEYKAYLGRNPKTGEDKEVKPKKLPCFKCSKELRERVDS